MHREITSGFVFSLCNPGSERALKLEVEMSRRCWRPGYQRRGFVTFKSEPPFSVDSLDVNLACSRRLCLSLGKATTREAATGLLTETTRDGKPPVIHHARFHERAMHGIHDGPEQPKPVHGSLVGTVVELGPAEFWAGIHRHAPFLSPDPAGDPGISMPADSPSRAWLKLEEAIRFFGLEFTPRDIVAEVGCAPGGVVLALLQRGASVIGVDPAGMADVVLEHAILARAEAPADRPWFFHCRKPAALAARRDLGNGVTWFMSDMNQSPEVVLRECGRFCRMAPDIRGVLITLKLTDLMQVAEKDRWASQLAELGFRTVRIQQLAAHHKELALLGLR